MKVAVRVQHGDVSSGQTTWYSGSFRPVMDSGASGVLGVIITVSHINDVVGKSVNAAAIQSVVDIDVSNVHRCSHIGCPPGIGCRLGMLQRVPFSDVPVPMAC